MDVISENKTSSSKLPGCPSAAPRRNYKHIENMKLQLQRSHHTNKELAGQKGKTKKEGEYLGVISWKMQRDEIPDKSKV